MRHQENPAHHDRDYRLPARSVTRREQGAVRPVRRRPAVVRRGVLVLRGIETRLGIADRLASCLADARDPASTIHSYADMIRARLFAIACGY